MAGKRVLLTLNPVILDKLRQKAEENLMTVQEYIANTLRKDILVKNKK